MVILSWNSFVRSVDHLFISYPWFDLFRSQSRADYDHPILHSFVLSFIHLCVLPLIYLFVLPFIHLFVLPFILSLVLPFIHSLILWIIRFSFITALPSLGFFRSVVGVVVNTR